MRLDELEARMERAGETVGACLITIRDKSLYLEAGYKSFEDYAEQRWGYKKTHAYRLMDHAKVAKRLQADGHMVPSEGQLRPAMALKRQCKTEDEFLDKVCNVVEITYSRADHEFDVPKITARDIITTMEDFGPGRPRQDIKPELREIRRLVLGVANAVAVKKYSGEEFVEKYGHVLKGAEEVFAWLEEYLETSPSEG